MVGANRIRPFDLTSVQGRMRFAPTFKKLAAKIEALHLKRQNQGLTEPKTEELADLMKSFNWQFVLRNEAIGLLLERGQDVSDCSKLSIDS